MGVRCLHSSLGKVIRLPLPYDEEEDVNFALANPWGHPEQKHRNVRCGEAGSGGSGV